MNIVDHARNSWAGQAHAPLCCAVIALASLAGCSDSEATGANSVQAPGGSGTPSAGSDSAGNSGSQAGSEASGSAAVGGKASGSSQAGSTATATAGRSTGNGGSSAGAAAAGQAGTTPATGGASGAPAAGGCSRELLSSTVDAYFAALAAHDATTLSLAAMPKFTENGKTLQLGDGAWKTAGMVKWKHSALDTQLCMSVSEAVIPDSGTDIPYGLRLKLDDQKISEIESIAVRKGDYFTSSNTMALIASGSENWEMILPVDKQPKRDDLMQIVDKYFTQFPAGACNFASDCKRLENGFSPGACTAGLSCSMSSTGMGSAGMKPRLHVFDVETGIAVGFVMFAGAYTDFHMFRVHDGEVHGVHAVLAKASSSGWE